jgi:hypothetical protein
MAILRFVQNEKRGQDEAQAEGKPLKKGKKSLRFTNPRLLNDNRN